MRLHDVISLISNYNLFSLARLNNVDDKLSWMGTQYREWQRNSRDPFFCPLIQRKESTVTVLCVSQAEAKPYANSRAGIFKYRKYLFQFSAPV